MIAVGRAIAGILAAVALVGCGSSAPTSSPSATTQPSAARPGLPSGAGADRDAQLQAHIDDWSAQNDPVGVAAAVLYPDGDLWLGSAGLADREAGTQVDPRGRFEIASVTKTFMSALTLRLAEEGIVDLDAPIDTCLPSFPASDAITLRMLLGHRAGVRDPTAELVSDRLGPPDPEKIFTSTELVDAAMDGTPEFAPGSRHEYSNANYWVLAACLEAITGTDTAMLLSEYIFDPLDLDDTILFDSSLPDVTVVNAYKDLDMDGTEDPMGTRPLPGLVTPAWTAGGIISSPEDLVRFLDGLFGGELISEGSLSAMLDRSSGGGSYALGIYDARGRWGHDGGIAGYLSAAFHDPRTGVSVAVLTNRFGPDAPQADRLAPDLAALANEFAPAP